jgi:hypothetical protein
MRWRTNQRYDDPFTTVPRPSLRRPLAATTATIFGLSLATLIPAERAVAAPAVPSFCAGTAPIVASAIGPSVDIRTCAIQGRLVVLPVAGGSDSIGVHVPAVGQGVGNAALAVDGEYELTVTNTGDAVTIEYSTPDTATTTGPVAAGNGTVVPDADPACNETAFNLEGHKWTSTVRWFYNESSVSRAGLNLSATIADIRGGNFNMTTGQNNCGFATGAFSASGAFQGNTSLFANIDSSGNCTSRFPDGQNTVSWGPFTPASLLALTCFEFSGGTMTEGDTYIGSNKGVVDSFPASCSNKYDLQSISTHEWGHVYGLAHETSGVDEVMYPTKFACELRRHLGRGDYNAMNTYY